MNEINKSEDAFKRRGQKNYRNYLIQMKKNDKNKIVIFASGAGSNAQKIIDYFKERKTAEIVLIVCNNPKAAVLQIAAKESIPVLLIEKNEFSKTGYLNEIKKLEPDLIILAGFLWKIPAKLIQAYQNKIINISSSKDSGEQRWPKRLNSNISCSKESIDFISLRNFKEINKEIKIKK